jgi:cytidine deaminase
VSAAPIVLDWDALVAAATAAREHAHAPYSRFRVGAALLADDGRIFAGANCENASYPLGLCAERGAISTAIAAGARRFLACAIVTSGPGAAAPCGGCRQVLAEFAPSFPVRSVALDGSGVLDTTVAALLPHAFDAAQLADATRSAP